MNQTESPISNCDLFKKKDLILNPDERILSFGGGADLNFNIFYNEISSIKLSDIVPKDVRIHFETSKNTLLYSFYAYRMSTVAILYSFSALEKALKLKLGINRHMGLKQKMKLAIEKELIIISDVPFTFQSDKTNQNEIMDEMLGSFCDFRNRLSHDPNFLAVIWNVPSILNQIALLINKLFLETNHTKSSL